jgi:putative mRNA 3-end processing factor
VWVTRGREEALEHWCVTHQMDSELNLVGYEDEDD